MRVKLLMLGMCLMLIAAGLAGCGDHHDQDEQFAFNGIHFWVPKALGTEVVQQGDTSIQYIFKNGTYPFKQGEPFLFFIYSYPQKMDEYRSKLYDEEKSMFRGVFDLTEKKKINSRMTWMKFQIKDSSKWKDNPMLLQGVVHMVQVETKSGTVEFVFELSMEYYEAHSKVIDGIINRITID
ncbi:hypothetical protein [Paenibacillus sp. y28]|uniref:hypothetical protein n=1 Tax=Paenibacillus sp. y28 TaxID=3129110 RepID=UPI0030161C48